MKPMLLSLGMATLALAACSPEPAAESDDNSPAVAATAEPAAQIAPAVQPGGPAIPSAMFGVFDEDGVACSNSFSETRLAIDAAGLRFYESRAQLTAVDSSDPNSLTGTFTFEGEGSSWTRKMTLSLYNDGAALRREDIVEGSNDTIHIYTRCG